MPLATIASTLAPFALLACPVGMGAMMWMMGRGNKREPAPVAEHAQPATLPTLEILREDHDRLSTEIARLESTERGRGGSARG